MCMSLSYLSPDKFSEALVTKIRFRMTHPFCYSGYDRWFCSFVQFSIFNGFPAIRGRKQRQGKRQPKEIDVPVSSICSWKKQYGNVWEKAHRFVDAERLKQLERPKTVSCKRRTRF